MEDNVSLAFEGMGHEFFETMATRGEIYEVAKVIKCNGIFEDEERDCILLAIVRTKNGEINLWVSDVGGKILM